MLHSTVRVEALTAEHDRSSFSCGNEDLDRYFRRTAGQDLRRRLSTIFVLVDLASGSIGGFYALSACEVDPGDLPTEVARRLPRRRLPATLIGRLAVDLQFRNQGLGEHLLIDALVRSVRASQEVGSMAVVVDAKDDRARSFYERYDFQQFQSAPHRLFLPMSEARLVAIRALGGHAAINGDVRETPE